MSYWACAQLEANRERLALHCLGLAGYQTYLPRIRVQRLTQTHKLGALTAPLFPGYAFVLVKQQWHAARWSPGVLRLVLDGDRPAKVPDKVIAELKGRERGGLVELPADPGFRRGDRVRVVAGPLAGLEGLVEGLRPHGRIEILLALLGSQQKVELAQAATVFCAARRPAK
jgi:transcriptional antiterminator RfaH